jgi:TRAP-type mannitol/chloroaromatic compound transport system substrate-binding protein
MNEGFWNGLSDHHKAIITAACYEENANQPEEAIANNGIYLKKLIEEHGVQLRSFSDEVWDAFGEASEEVFAETREHSPLAAKINDDFQASLRANGSYTKIAEVEFSNQRNRVLGL